MGNRVNLIRMNKYHQNLIRINKICFIINKIRNKHLPQNLIKQFYKLKHLKMDKYTVNKSPNVNNYIKNHN
jgi:hypothetical protein